MATVDFDDYDPTPYGGGYDQAVAYGRPLPPDEEICYRIDSASTSSSSYGSKYGHSSSAAQKYGGGSTPSFDQSSYRPNAPTLDPYDYSGGGRKPSGYGGGRVEEDESSYVRPKPKPTPDYDFHPQEEERFGGGGGGYRHQSKPIPDYQFDPEGYGSVKPFSHVDEPMQEGFGEYGRPKPKPAPYGFRPEQEGYSYTTPEPPVEPSYGFEGSGYGRIPPRLPEEVGDYGFDGRPHDQGGRWAPERQEAEERFEHGGRRKQELGSGFEYGRSEEHHTYGGGTGYRREEGEGYHKPSYSRDEHEGEGYGHRKYKNQSDDEDDGGEKKRHGRHNRNRRHEDD